MAGVDLTVIEGIEESTALVLLSEFATDMSRWPSVKHFCSWLGLCPKYALTQETDRGERQSGKKSAG